MEKEGAGCPQRKKNRLENRDYSSVGAYFLTICTSERRNYFWESEDTAVGSPQQVRLSPYGKIVQQTIGKIPSVYPALKVAHSVIMPDHVHILLVICADGCGRPMVAPTISRVVQHLKGTATKRIGHSVWQKSFSDHVIRSRPDYEAHVRYIHENPMKWRFQHLRADE